MEGSQSWLSQNWFNVVQTAFFVVSAYYVSASFRRDAEAKQREAKAREETNLLTLLEQHNTFWQQAYERPELRRVLSVDADAKQQPITPAEERFLSVAIVRFQAGWQLAKPGTFLTREILAADVRATFSLPLFSAVWEKAKSAQISGFVKFVEQALKTPNKVH